MTIPAHSSTLPELITSLEACKSVVDRRTRQSESQDYAFGPANIHRALVLSAFDILDHPEGSIDRYEACCRCAFVQEHTETKKIRVAFETCGSRYCPKCGDIYRANLSRKLEAEIGTVAKNEWRFITLTLRSSDLRLTERLDHLVASFRRLRQQQIWRVTVIHWRAVIEITFNHQSHQWHPHVHVLAKGLYLPQKKLANAWATASTDSSIVDIRKVNNGTQAMRYLSKYLGKTPSFDTLDDPLGRTVEYLEAMINRKLVLASRGDCFDEFESPPTTPEKDQGHWMWLIDFSTLISQVQDGKPKAISLLDRLHSGATEPTQPDLWKGT